MTHETFDRLARLYMDAVFRLAFSYLKNRSDAEDVTQTALLRLYQCQKEFESDEHVKHWLLRVAVNECKKLWRSPWQRRESLETYAESLSFPQPRDRELFYAIMALEKKYRVVIVLHYCEGYTIREMAALLQLPPGTVGTRLNRGREKLKAYLTEAD